ncbi:hypothetical protein [Spirosoma pollinicola]|uniref:Uncharacterized protein n=1 Tax=Spirosoma pollinicola TaxID=2057025 RepID=A0A2K8ZB39_9BACT|nr:hypothetical protein [Spirosoma pollinicola]AUD07087.1 hypothetical protein CWM47_37880 [Spirosoma pollinicola]
MERKFNALLRYFTKKSRHKELTTLYERKKVELPFYLNELALHKFILERQQNTFAEEYHLHERHTELCGICLQAIQRLDELISALDLNHSEDVQDYLKAYNRNKTVKNPRGFNYQLNSN